LLLLGLSGTTTATVLRILSLLQEQDTHCRVFREACGDNSSSVACTNHNVIKDSSSGIVFKKVTGGRMSLMLLLLPTERRRRGRGGGRVDYSRREGKKEEKGDGKATKHSCLLALWIVVGGACCVGDGGLCVYVSELILWREGNKIK
jgi:hypothetical protein